MSDPLTFSEKEKKEIHKKMISFKKEIEKEYGKKKCEENMCHIINLFGDNGVGMLTAYGNIEGLTNVICSLTANVVNAVGDAMGKTEKEPILLSFVVGLAKGVRKSWDEEAFASPKKK